MTINDWISVAACVAAVWVTGLFLFLFFGVLGLFR